MIQAVKCPTHHRLLPQHQQGEGYRFHPLLFGAGNLLSRTKYGHHLLTDSQESRVNRDGWRMLPCTWV